MTTQNGTGYGRNFDGKPGDVLARLEEMLATTPGSALATRPMKRSLLEATVAEIKRLRHAVVEYREENEALFRAMDAEEQR